jgi:dihydroorotate dehydrogenase
MAATPTARLANIIATARRARLRETRRTATSFMARAGAGTLEALATILFRSTADIVSESEAELAHCSPKLPGSRLKSGKIALMWYPAIRPALFALDPEKAHRLVLEGLRLAGTGRASGFNASAPIDCMGLRFPNRVGLAAGFDKNATAVDGLGRLGFGFIEVGTVTPRPQRGQGKPRLFRLPAANALVNRLGFPNDGATAVAARLRRRRYRGVVGINIGKNADTPLARAVDDYVSCLRKLRSVANYITINVSSPNTAGLRELQGGDYLRPLLTSLIEERDRGAATEGRKLPLLVKLSPDLSVDELRFITDLLKVLPIDGVVATNTTVGRENSIHCGRLHGWSQRTAAEIPCPRRGYSTSRATGRRFPNHWSRGNRLS